MGRKSGEKLETNLYTKHKYNTMNEIKYENQEFLMLDYTATVDGIPLLH